MDEDGIIHNDSPFINMEAQIHNQRNSLRTSIRKTNIETRETIAKFHENAAKAILNGNQTTSTKKIESSLSELMELDDVNDLILRANAPPDRHDKTLGEALKVAKARRYYQEQFGKIQEKLEMNKYTLWFSKKYEKQYSKHIQENSTRRTFYCFFIGFFSLGGYFIYEYIDKKFTCNKIGINPNSETCAIREKWLIILSFIIPLTIMSFGFLTTILPFKIFKKYRELITSIIFLFCGLCLIIKKPLQNKKGPILPLYILLIPVFGMTRIRFTHGCAIGWLLFFLYLGIEGKFSTQDTGIDIVYQSINYAISIIGGMVSHYRQELLRRRNYALSLPFGSEHIEDDDVARQLKTEKFSKSRLMYRWSRAFRNKKVEECFYKFWYLIDPFPYENPNATILHQGVFRVLRFAIYGLILNQLVLGIQDYQSLKIGGSDREFIIAFILRYGIVIPVYLSAGLFMYFMGRAFYEKWLKETEQSTSSMDSAILGETKYNNTKLLLLDKLPNKGGYVKTAQLYAAFVIAIHITAMGGLLLVVSRKNKMKNKYPQPVYYMGFLNSILFAHRSGFRMRFIYATHCTILVVFLFIISSYIYSNDNMIEFACFSIVVLVLGMMISYEEEGLRRIFFILKSIRMLEFEEWFSTVLRMQIWVREKLKKTISLIRQKHSNSDENNLNIHINKDTIVTNASAQMTMASKYGVYTQGLNFIIAIISLIVKEVAKSKVN